MTRQSRQLRRLVVTCSLLQRFETVICAPVGAPLADWAGLVLLKLAVRLHTGQRVGRRGRRPAPAGSTRRSNAVIFRGRLEPACHAIQTVYTDRRTRAYTRARAAIRDTRYHICMWRRGRCARARIAPPRAPGAGADGGSGCQGALEARAGLVATVPRLESWKKKTN